ncbi:MAG TPA: class I SAM-dependent methyltransferase [Prolixibacteraceae bacterium]|nr:class I SAM-dependent methyltransferase [Prolixibacteraceae bacterium]
MNNGIACKICGNIANNRIHLAKERLLNMRDEFPYLECANCYCIQIVETPDNLSKYYPAEYYSFRNPKFGLALNPLVYFLKKSLIRHYLKKFDPAGALLSLFLPHPFPWMKPGLLSFKSAILDVGCGSGRVIRSMQRSGFKNLTGIDPFLEKDLQNSPELKILKKDLFEMTGKFDFIMLHHAFEHMDHPDRVLGKIRELLKPTGKLLIRIPVANAYAWRKYRTHWFALDAPRHLFLHTPHSIHLLAQKAGLTVDRIDYDSSFVQFASSEKYLRDIPYSDDFSMFSRKQMRDFSKEAERLNRIGDGDCACFYLSV